MVAEGSILGGDGNMKPAFFAPDRTTDRRLGMVDANALTQGAPCHDPLDMNHEMKWNTL